jgi:predicted nucleic acid-binding protein
MRDRAFFDTNILVYLYSEDESQKQKLAEQCFSQYEGMISTQSLNEFCNVCLRKLKRNIYEIGKAIQEILSNATLVAINEETILNALRIHHKYGYSYFDSLMVATALATDCKTLLSEDMQNGQVIDEKTVIKNPFAAV